MINRDPVLWTTFAPPADDAFVALATDWVGDSEPDFVDLVWQGFELLKTRPSPFDDRDLERSISQLLAAAIDDIVPGEAPFYVQHGPYERETMLLPPAQPPAYDIAFVFRADPRVMWPLEAKKLTSPNALAEYLDDVRNQFLTCRYAPFSASGAMLGYLLSGVAEQALANIEQRLAVNLEDEQLSPDRPHRSSVHQRLVPAGKPYPAQFRCHHLILGFHGLARQRRASLP